MALFRGGGPKGPIIYILIHFFMCASFTEISQNLRSLTILQQAQHIDYRVLRIDVILEHKRINQNISNISIWKILS